MQYDVDTALNFFAQSARAAEKHVKTLVVMECDEKDVLLSLPIIVGEILKAHGDSDANAFRNTLRALTAIAAIAEQWTMDATECECEDCTARAVAAERAKAEARAQEFADMKDFYWVAPIEDNQGMIVTQNPDAYKTVQPGTWNRIRAVDYKSACVAAHEARAKLTKGN